MEKRLRRFKRKVQRKTHQGGEASLLLPEAGEKRRLKQALARKRARKKIRKESD